jgi:hypothetical protein
MDNADSTQGDSASDTKLIPSDALTEQHKVDHTKTDPDYKSPKPKLNRLKCWRRIKISWGRTKFHDMVIAGATVVIAAVGIGQLIVYLQMKNIMLSSGHQTQQLIDAANIEASAATKNAEATKQFADISSKNLSFTKGIARLTVGLANVIIEKSYMPIKHDSRTGSVSVAVKLDNTEKPIAYNVRIAVSLDLRDSPPRPQEYAFPDKAFLNLPPLKKGPENGKFYFMGDRPEWAPLKYFPPEKFRRIEPNIMVYVWGIYTYNDFPEETLTIAFCRYAPAKDALAEKYAKNGYTQPYTDCPPENIPKEQ